MIEVREKCCRKFFYLLTILMFSVLLVISSTTAQPPTFEVKMELDSSNEIIDTSADVSEPMVQVGGVVTLDSLSPMYIKVNLNIDDDWDSTVEPSNFTLQVNVTGKVIQNIIITVKAPLGVENNTDHSVRVTGTWKYYEDLPGGGEINPVTLYLTSHNTSTDNGNGKNGDGNGGKDDEKGFLPGFESAMVISGTLIIIFVIGKSRRKRN